MHAAIEAGRPAIITGGANGIGLATAGRLLALGMRAILVDNDEDCLAAAAKTLDGGRDKVATRALDVADRSAFEGVAAELLEEYGPPAVLMNNAAIAQGGDVLADPAQWERLLAVNLMGVFNGVSIFLPSMIESDRPALVVNTGSKQGITQPPGNTAYNVAKSAVKSLTEGLAHTLREKTGERVTAHLLIPGFTYTGMMRPHFAEKPAAAWTSEQVSDYLLAALDRGDFYILCPDNETTPEMDARRIAWAAGDLIENRPALSRWHPDFKARFDAYMQG